MTTRATYRARRRANAYRTAEYVRFHQARLCVRLKDNMRAYMYEHQVEWFQRALEKAREAERSRRAVFDMGDVIYDDKAEPCAKWGLGPTWPLAEALDHMASLLYRVNRDHELPGEYDLVPKPKGRST